MKKSMPMMIVCFMMFALLALGGISAGAQEIEDARLEGFVLHSEEEMILLDTQEYGEIQVNVDENTAFEGIDPMPEENAYLYITYDGNMSASLPGQIYAQKVEAFVISGEVLDAAEGYLRIAEDDTAEEVIVLLPEGAELPIVGLRIRAYTDGMMALSLPPQVNALSICAAEPTCIEGETFAMCID
ncbi:MAG: hypothetical protein ACOYI8_09475 [Christensenellales bacterium]